MVMTYSEQVLAGVIANRMAAQPDRAIVTFENGGVRPDDLRTYRGLWEQGQKLAQVLIDHGMGVGDHFALLMNNHVEFVDAMVAASISGTVFVPIDARTSGDKLTFMLEMAECKGVIAADYALDNVVKVRSQLPGLQWIIGFETDEGKKPLTSYPGVAPYADALPLEAPDITIRTVDPERAMELIFSSGTTGDPKGIITTHARYCGLGAMTPGLIGYRTGDILYSGLSLTHGNAQFITLGSALVGGFPCVLSRKFSKSRLWDITRRYGCTSFNLLGGMMTAVFADPRKPDDADNPVRLIISSGMPKAIWEEFEQRYNVQILEFYAAIEGGMSIKPVGVGPIGSIGKPPVTLLYRIVDENGNDCAPGISGELLFRPGDGSPAKVEYYRNSEASAAKVKDGWLHMGDIVVADQDGWIFFLYRKGGAIRRNGEFINSGFIEKVIAENDTVDDVYVYGITSTNGTPGEKEVVAAIVPKDRAGFKPEAIYMMCRQKLEPSQMPRYLQLLDIIPKTASEKPQDRFLIELFETQPTSVYTENHR